MKARRGFSTLETVVALTIFLGVITAVSITAVQLSAVLQRAEFKQDTLAALDRSLELLSQAPFEQLVAERFTVPDACGDLGESRRTSCIQVSGNDMVVSYTTSLGSDPVAGTGTAGSYVTLTASTTMPDGASVTRSRKMSAPSLGYTGDGAVLRVRSLSDETVDQLPLYVLNASGAAVVSSVPFVDGLAVIRVPGDACSGSGAPCRLALSTGSSWWTTGTYTLAPPDIMGSGSQLVLEPGTFSDLAVHVGPIGTATIDLLGRGPDGVDTKPSSAIAGSVCVWGTFSDGSGRRSSPFCNFDDATKITVSSFIDLPTGRRYPLPSGFALSLTIDPPDGVCPATSAYPSGYQPKGITAAGAWSTAGVCTSWTWGTPERFGPEGSSEIATFPEDLELTSDGSAYELVWTADSAGSADWAQVSVGAAHACGVDVSSGLYCWGSNGSGRTGLGLRDGATTQPAQVGTATNWRQVSAGYAHTCGVTTNNALYCWGDGSTGALGNGAYTSAQTTPVQISGQWSEVSAGEGFTCAVSLSGTVSCWGSDEYGQLGLGNTASGVFTAADSLPLAYSPTKVAVQADGDIWVTGSSSRVTRMSSTGSLLRTVSLATLAGATGIYGMADGPDGAVWVSVTTNSSPRLVRVSDEGSVTYVSLPSGNPGGLAQGPDGALWVITGGGSTLSRVTVDSTVTTYTSSTCAFGALQSVATGPDGKVWVVSWSSSSSGTYSIVRLNADSDPCATDSSSSVLTGSASGSGTNLVEGPDAAMWFSAGTKLARVPVTGSTTSFTITALTSLVAGADGSLWGTDTSGSRLVSVDPSSGSTANSSSVSAPQGIGRAADGSMWVAASGSNQLTHFNARVNTPQTTSATNTWTHISTGAHHTCGIAASRVYCWGANSTAQAGQQPVGSSSVAPSPQAVTAPTEISGGDADFSQVSAGGSHTCALRASTQEAHCFGSNAYGQLGVDSGDGRVPQAVVLATYSQLGSSPVVSPDGSGGTWATSESGGVTRFTHITSSGSRTAATGSGTPVGALLGADSNLWVATSGPNKVVKVTAAGVVTSYPTSGALSGAPTSMVVGSDGNVWLTLTSNRLARVTSTGVISEFTAATGADNLASGGDGDLWYTAGTSLVHASPASASAYTSASLSVSGTIDGLAWGPDDNLWLALTSENKIAQVDTYGTLLDEYTVPTASSQPFGLTLGPDGALWFAERSGRKLGHITTDGVITESSVGSGANLDSFAVGPEGSLHAAFTASGVGAVSRLASISATGVDALGSLGSVAAGLDHSCTTRDGELWCWGHGNTYQLGNGGTDSQAIPAAADSSHPWNNVAASAWSGTACATASDSLGACWGSNSGGVTGLGRTTGTTSRPELLSTSNSTAASTGTPAAGNQLVTPWTMARLAANALPAGCASDSASSTTCTSVAGLVPETMSGAPNACSTDVFCYSVVNAPPRLSTPMSPYALRPSGTLAVGSWNSTSIAFVDPDGDSLTYRFSSLPQNGTLSLTQGGASVGTSAWTPVSSGQSVPLYFAPVIGFSNLDSFVVQVSDATNATQSFRVYLYANNTPVLIQADSATIAQGASGVSVPVAVTNADGTAAASTAVTLTVPTGLSVGSGTLLTDSTGIARFTLNAGSLAAGPYTLTAQVANGVSTTLTATVTKAAGSVTIGALATTAQGGSQVASVGLTDRAGAALGSTLVRLEVLDPSGEVSTLVRPMTGACITDGTGACTSTVEMSSKAAAGTYTMRATSGEASSSRTFTVSQSLASLSSNAATAASDTYGSLVTASSPSAFWRLDGSSSASVSATPGPTGTLSGSYSLSRDPLAGGGQSASVRVNGGYMCTSTPVTLNGSETLEAWVRPETFSTGADPRSFLLGTSDGTQALVLGRADTAGSGAVPTFIATMGGNTYTVYPQGFELKTDTTYHIVGVAGSGRVELFVNGRLVASQTSSGSVSSSANWCAGARSGSLPFTGLLDELAVYPGSIAGATVSRHYGTGLASSSAGGAATAELTQGGSAGLTITASDGAGDIMASMPISVALAGTGVSVSATSLTTNAQGEASLTLSSTSTADTSAPAVVTFSAGDVSLRYVVTVLGAPASITAADLTVPQGGSGQVSVTVLDGASRPLSDAVVTVSPVTPVSGLNVSPQVTTDSSGVAVVELTAGADVALGAFSMELSSGSATGSFTATTTSGPGRIFIDPGDEIPQGSTTQVVVRALDSNDSGIDNQSVQLSCIACGLTFTGRTNTVAGKATFTVTDSGGVNPPGLYTVIVTSGGNSFPSQLRVRPIANVISATPVSVGAGDSAAAFVNVSDRSGAGVANAVITTTSTTSGINVRPVLSGPSGRAVIAVAVSSGVTPGAYNLVVSSGTATTTLVVTVE